MKVSVLKKSFVLALFSSLFALANAKAATVPVPYVDLQKYTGTWYEIASIPQSFQRGCSCVTAEYTQKKDGNIAVVNSCLKDNKLKKVKGTAYVVNTTTNSELEVGFFLEFLPIFRGEYWIIMLDQGYQYAVVSNKKGSTLWILSRTPTMSKETYDHIIDTIQTQVDVSKIVPMEQNNCNRG